MIDLDEFYEQAWDDGWRAATEALGELVEALADDVRFEVGSAPLCDAADPDVGRA